MTNIYSNYILYIMICLYKLKLNSYLKYKFLYIGANINNKNYKILIKYT